MKTAKRSKGNIRKEKNASGENFNKKRYVEGCDEKCIEN